MLTYSASTMSTMFSPNKTRFIFIVFMVMCSISESFRLQTEKSLTAVRGGSISLPCMFSVPAQAVYWYKHNFTKAPYAGASLVARDSFGFRDPLQGFERFSITKDHSLIIRTITVHDETTYSCLVVEVENERAYTDLRVIALAEPREPIIESCNVTATGRCIYDIDENSQENVTLVCGVYNVRPLPDLTWIRSDGRALENETHQTQEKNGLFNISSRTQVSKSNLDHRYTCQANGEAVNGTSSTIITINKEYDKTVFNDRVTGIGWKIVAAVLGLGLFSSLVYSRRRCSWPYTTREHEDTKRSKKDGIFMTASSNVADEPDQDSERREVDGILTTVVDTDADEPDRDRRESNWWCSCGNCPVMQTDVECLCCRELMRCREIQTNGCIIDSKEFEDVCLNRKLIRTTLTLRSKDHRIPENFGNRSNRFIAYKLWTDYLHGYLGKGVRRPLPACVVTRVRQEFPEENDAYTGFKYGNVGKLERRNQGASCSNNPECSRDISLNENTDKD